MYLWIKTLFLTCDTYFHHSCAGRLWCIYELNLSCIRVTWLIHDSFLIYIKNTSSGITEQYFGHSCGGRFYIIWGGSFEFIRDMTHSWLSLDICAASVQAKKKRMLQPRCKHMILLKVRVTLQVLLFFCSSWMNTSKRYCIRPCLSMNEYKQRILYSLMKRKTLRRKQTWVMSHMELWVMSWSSM